MLDRLELERFTRSKVFNELVSEIAEAMTVIGQEQLNMFLMALDDARAKLLAAIKTTSPKPTERETNAISEPPPVAQTAVTATEIPERGRLF